MNLLFPEAMQDQSPDVGILNDCHVSPLLLYNAADPPRVIATNRPLEPMPVLEKLKIELVLSSQTVTTVITISLIKSTPPTSLPTIVIVSPTAYPTPPFDIVTV
jgi:hypothetical protein